MYMYLIRRNKKRELNLEIINRTTTKYNVHVHVLVYTPFASFNVGKWQNVLVFVLSVLSTLHRGGEGQNVCKTKCFKYDKGCSFSKIFN